MKMVSSPITQIGNYKYPESVTFSTAYKVAEKTHVEGGDFMPNLKVADELGYKFSNPAGVPGYVYRKLDELCSWGLVTRDRGGVKTTELGKQACSSSPNEKYEAIVKAIDSFPLFKKAYNEWRGEIPDTDTALAGKLKTLTGVEYDDALKHATALRKLMGDCFPYLSGSGNLAQVIVEKPSDNRQVMSSGYGQPSIIADDSKPYGELRTTMGSITIKNSASVALAKHILTVLDQEFKQHGGTELPKIPKKKRAQDESKEETKSEN